MGLIKAALGAAGGVMADQWKEYFYCESIPVDVLVCKGQKRTTGRGSNTKGSPNVISNGSVVAVADGQCMCIVENGKVVDICAVPGEFVYDTSIAPSLFTGDLGENIKNTFSQIGKRFAFGGDAFEEPGLSIDPFRCIGCGDCARACTHKAIAANPSGTMRIIGERCDECGNCYHVCPAGAVIGKGIA